MPTTLHGIPSQIHLDKKRCHLSSTFQRHLYNSNQGQNFTWTRGEMAAPKFFIKNIIIYMCTNFSNFVL